MKKMRHSRLATFMHNLKFATGIGCISILFITAAQCNKADELIGPIPSIITEVAYEGDSLVYLKAWDTLKPQKLLATKDTTKKVTRAPTQKVKKKKVVVKKKKFRSIQDRENAEFEQWYKSKHKK